MKFICQACGRENETGDTIGRRDTCFHCGADLRACLQCRHFDRAAANDCREPQAEPVADKGKANFCDFYQPAKGGPARQEKALSRDEAAARWEALFGKK